MIAAKQNKVGMVIPVYNGGAIWVECAKKINKYKNDDMRIIVIDSSSTDGSDKVAVQNGFECLQINKKDFDHGGTRNLGLNILKDDCDIIVYLTHDVIIGDEYTLINLLSLFEDENIAAVYGRQLPRLLATPIESHARFFNYGPDSHIRNMTDIVRYGMKTAFMSDAFAAYRVADLLAVGGFPDKIICGEDMVTAAKMIKNGRSIAYAAQAIAYHSHDYNWIQEAQRYFDIGVMHHEQRWILDEFGKPEGEGVRFLKSELTYLWDHSKKDISSSLLRTFLKYSGYRLGRSSGSLPLSIKKRLSMNTGYWKNA